MDLLAIGIGAAAIAGITIVQLKSRFRLGEPTMANAQFVQITTPDDLDAVFTSSSERPRVVFLDDPSCPISAAARRRIGRLDGEVLTIDVSRQKDLSRRIATRTGVRHESPQAFVVKDGVAVWDASHGNISDLAIAQAIARLAQNDASSTAASPVDTVPPAV